MYSIVVFKIAVFLIRTMIFFQFQLILYSPTILFILKNVLKNADHARLFCLFVYMSAFIYGPIFLAYICYFGSSGFGI